MVAAASFDDVVAISGFSMCIGVAIGAQGPLWQSALHGPISVALGLASGALAGCLAGLTALWNSQAKRSAALLLSAAALAFFFTHTPFAIFGHTHFTGASALAPLAAAVVAAANWEAGTCSPAAPFSHRKPGCIAELLVDGGGGDGDGGSAMEERRRCFAHDTGQDLAAIWDAVAQPLLFGVIGSALDLRSLSGTSVARAAVVICAGVGARIPVGYFSTAGAGMTAKERAFIALAWIPKATVQAALASVPLEMARSELRSGTHRYAQYEEWGTDIITVAVLSIVLTAPVGLLVIEHLGPKWLTAEKGEEKKEGEADGNGGMVGAEGADTAVVFRDPYDGSQPELRSEYSK